MKVREVLRDCLSEALATSFFAAMRMHPLAIGGRVLRPDGRAGWRAQVFFWADARPLGEQLDQAARVGFVAVSRFADLGIDAAHIEQLLEVRADELEHAAARVHADHGELDDEAAVERCAAIAVAELRLFRSERAAA